MPQRELASSMAPKNTIAPRQTAVPVDGSAVDVTDGEAQTIIFNFGTNIDPDATIMIQEDDGAGGWTDLTPVETPALNTKLYGLPYPTPPVFGQVRYAYVGSALTIRAQLLTVDAATDVAVYVIAESLAERANLVGFLA